MRNNGLLYFFLYFLFFTSINHSVFSRDFRFLEKLGEGTFGEVYLEGGKAVKICSFDLNMLDSLATIKEAAASGGCQHAHF